jgi:hypothetical protein
MSDFSELKAQIEITIQSLKLKEQSSNEDIIQTYIEKYESVLALIEAEASTELVIKKSNTLLNCARAYMETSNSYNQDFLQEMGKTEKIVKAL